MKYLRLLSSMMFSLVVLLTDLAYSFGFAIKTFTPRQPRFRSLA